MVGFTLIELMVVVGIIAILAAIMFPVFSRVRENGRQVTCLSNHRQLALAIKMYADDQERYPDTDWEGAIADYTGGKHLLVCPNAEEDQQAEHGYGMNSYLHGLKTDVIARPQLVVCTCDSATTSTVSADHKRHRGIGVYSHLDGSVVRKKIPEEGGRFAAGSFPLNPIITVGNTTIDAAPESFVDYSANTPIAKEFRFVGPYGSDDETMAVSTPAGLLDLDYIEESIIAKLSADEIPEPGEKAPSIEDIMKLSSDPAEAKLVTTWQVPTLGTWTPGSGSPQKCVKLELEGNFNATYPKRTAYAMLFFYNDQAQSATMKFLMDDMGIVWMNGKEIFRDPLANDLTAEQAVNQVTMNIPKGISYILYRSTNWEAGGAKFNIIFDIPVKVGGAI